MAGQPALLAHLHRDVPPWYLRLGQAQPMRMLRMAVKLTRRWSLGLSGAHCAAPIIFSRSSRTWCSYRSATSRWWPARTIPMLPPATFDAGRARVPRRRLFRPRGFHIAPTPRRRCPMKRLLLTIGLATGLLLAAAMSASSTTSTRACRARPLSHRSLGRAAGGADRRREPSGMIGT